MLIKLSSLGWLIILLVLLTLSQRRLHFEIQAIFYGITRRADISLVLFSLLFIPGVILHETSHFLAARLMGVRTGRISVIPQALPNGRLQMGFVETASTDIVRDAVIGSAPLFVGCAFVLYVAFIPLGLASVWAEFIGGDLTVFSSAFLTMYQQPDFWLWFYLVFVVSSTMMPSASDRRAWLPLGLFALVIIIIALLTGPGGYLADIWVSVSPQINLGIYALVLIFGVSVAFHILLLVPAWLLRLVLWRIHPVRIQN
jgi:hypothetical protein